jgi:glutathione reductase (NADPH)
MADAGSYDFDLFVIGTGSGGMRAVKKAKGFGVGSVGTCDMPFSQLSVEGRSICDANTVGGVGGTCVLRGCVPKKYFWYASHFKHLFEDAKGYGWDVEVKGHDWNTLLTKKRAETERLHKTQLEKRMPAAGVEVLTGRGKLLDAHTIQVGAPANRTVTAKTILIATGTTPTVIDIPGKEHCISSDHILELETLPKRLGVIGAGYIACEFACMFANWGCDTHLVYRKDLPLRGFDDDCRSFLARQMDKLCGVQLHPGCSPTRVEKQPDGKYTLYSKDAAGVETALADCDEVLMATGRHANVWNLGLEAAGVEMNGNKVKVDEFSQTTCPNIYAIGDVTDRMQLTPVAIQEAMAFLSNVYGGKKYAIDYDTVASAVFTQPPMGTCGLTEEDAVKKYPNLDVYMDGDGGGWQAEYFNFTESAEELLVKVLVNVDDDRVVGMWIVGKDAGEIMQGFGAAIKCGVTKQQLFDTVAIHPTIAEELVCIPGIDQFPATRRYRNHKLAADHEDHKVGEVDFNMALLEATNG